MAVARSGVVCLIAALCLDQGLHGGAFALDAQIKWLAVFVVFDLQVGTAFDEQRGDVPVLGSDRDMQCSIAGVIRRVDVETGIQKGGHDWCTLLVVECDVQKGFGITGQAVIDIGPRLEEALDGSGLGGVAGGGADGGQSLVGLDGNIGSFPDHVLDDLVRHLVVVRGVMERRQTEVVLDGQIRPGIDQKPDNVMIVRVPCRIQEWDGPGIF